MEEKCEKISNTEVVEEIKYLGVIVRAKRGNYLSREMPSTNLEKIYTSSYRSLNFQQLFFYNIFCAMRNL